MEGGGGSSVGHEFKHTKCHGIDDVCIQRQGNYLFRQQISAILPYVWRIAKIS